ncbi:LysR family transcriptional regulator [Domibacillus robiginosus]|uniref:LysR family transcriptional regulator n=1 Tax=Domibacillus robiginosus TaxID=1071054 RepID=UPI00067AC392|nr:LysR family transcriptional regulator [Domibacillus robiginosus]
MDSKDLKAFLAVYDYKSITKAAKSLYMTSQGLSQLIKKLEQELEIKLFYRTTRGVDPTPYGDVFYEKAEGMLKDLASIKNLVKEKGAERKKVLSVASTYGVLAYLTVDFLVDFRNIYPDIDLDFQEMTDDIVEESIWSEKMDVGFLAGPIDVLKFDADPFTSHKHCLVIHEDHPLAAKDYIDYVDLENEPIALIGRAFRPYYNNMNRFLKRGVKPNILTETSEIGLTHQVAHANKGVGLSVDFCAYSNPYSNTVIRPFLDFEECTWDTYLILKRGKLVSKEAEIFQRFALNWLERNRSRLFKWRINQKLDRKLI